MPEVDDGGDDRGVGDGVGGGDGGRAVTVVSPGSGDGAVLRAAPVRVDRGAEQRLLKRQLGAFYRARLR